MEIKLKEIKYKPKKSDNCLNNSKITELAPKSTAKPFQLDFRYRHLSEKELRGLVEVKAAQRQYDKAINLLTQLLEYNPLSAIDYNNRGLMYYRLGDLDSAITDLTHAIKLDPKLDSAYNNRANCYAAQGEFYKSLQDYDKVLDINPSNVRARINQGITFRQLAMYEMAIENFDIALLFSQKLQGRIYAERGKAYHLRGDWNCAVADYCRAIELLQDKQYQSDYVKKIQSALATILEQAS